MKNRGRNFVRSLVGGRFLVTKERFYISHQFARGNLRLFGIRIKLTPYNTFWAKTFSTLAKLLRNTEE